MKRGEKGLKWEFCRDTRGKCRSFGAQIFVISETFCMDRVVEINHRVEGMKRLSRMMCL